MSKVAWKSHPGGVLEKRVTADGQTVSYWFARVRHDGRQLKFAAPSEEKARERAAALRYERDRAKFLGVEWKPPKERAAAAGKMPTVAEFAKMFLRDWAAGKASERFYRSRVTQIVEKLGRKRIDRLTVNDVQRFHRNRLKDGRPSKKATKTKTAKTQRTAGKTSPTTANHDLNVLRIMLNRAVEWGYVTENVARQVRPAKVEKRPERFLYHEEAQRLFNAAPPWLRPMLEVACHTGMRQGELLSLTWDRVDLRRGVIQVTGTKSKQPRTVPMTERVREVLKGLPRHVGTDLVFTKSGRAVTQTILKREWPGLLKRAKITAFRFHDMRHTAASWMVMAGTPLYEVQQILGHGSYAMVQRYAHLAPDFLQGAARRLDQFTPPSEPEKADEAD